MIVTGPQFSLNNYIEVDNFWSSGAESEFLSPKLPLEQRKDGHKSGKVGGLGPTIIGYSHAIKRNKSS